MSFFNNLKIGKKLIISFIVIAILASVSGIVSIFAMSDMNETSTRVLEDYGFSQGDIGKALTVVADSNRCVRDIIGFTDEAAIQTAKTRMEKNQNSYKDYRAAVEGTLSTDQEYAQFDKIEEAYQAYNSKRSEVLALGDTLNAVQSREAQELAVAELDPLYDTFYQEWAALMDMNVVTGDQLNQETTKTANGFILISLGLTVVSLVVSLVLGTIIARGISRPLDACANRLVKLSEGDLATAVPESTSRDETGILLGALKDSVEKLKAMIRDMDYLLSEIAAGDFDVRTKDEKAYVGEFRTLLLSVRKMNLDMSSTIVQIDQAADQVASGSDQVSSGAQALSQGATEQASSVEELAATINEISAQVRKNADNAVDASQKAAESGVQMAQSNDRMKEMIQAMAKISNSSSEIGKIIKTIDDIAFQTNILALNAAVEAARAGAAGKGFAVVADEVRNLAGKSAEAAKNTTSLIEEALKAVKDGTAIADDTAKTLMNAVESSEAAIGKIAMISDASKEQAGSIAQVTQGVDQISSVVQTNSATSEESAAASEELSSQAQLLKTLVRRFKVRKESSAEDQVPVNVPTVPYVPTVYNKTYDKIGVDKY